MPISASIALLAVSVGLSAQQPPARQPSAYEELQTFSAVLNHIRVNYMDSVTYTQLVRAAIDGYSTPSIPTAASSRTPTATKPASSSAASSPSPAWCLRTPTAPPAS